jgi:hypothetical protein
MGSRYALYPKATRSEWNIEVTRVPPKLKQAKPIKTARAPKKTADISRFASGDSNGPLVLERRVLVELARLVFFADFLVAIVISLYQTIRIIIQLPPKNTRSSGATRLWGGTGASI